jgi:uncharacterized protein YdeI (YjbR/CyaY-like superfamily)
MSVSPTNPDVDFFFAKAGKWQDHCNRLRTLVLECALVEELKWGVPCYTADKRNVVIIHGFKDYCALLFFNGALLKDPEGILVQQTGNVQAGRQIRFTGIDEIDRLEPVLKAYIDEAIAAEKAGLKVSLKSTADFAVPEEFQARIEAMPELRTAFAALTPGRQRAYLLHFAGAKQAKTREARIDKCLARILDGKGLDD